MKIWSVWSTQTISNDAQEKWVRQPPHSNTQKSRLSMRRWSIFKNVRNAQDYLERKSQVSIFSAYKRKPKNFKPEQAKIILEKPKNFLSGRPKLGPTNDNIFSGFVLILARLSVVPQVDSQE